MATKILARRGAASALPTLDISELGYATDTKAGFIGDGTNAPPSFMTSKTTALFDYTAALGVKHKTVWATKTDANAAAVSLVIGANANTGFYAPDVGQIAISAAGTNVWTATSTAITANVNFSVGSTGFLRVAKGTTAQRVVGATGGELRLNTSTGNGVLEFADATGAWNQLLSTSPLNPWAVNSGTNNALVATLASLPTSLTDGLIARVKILASNTAATTLNVNGLGVTNVVLPTGAPLSGGELVTGMIGVFCYDPGYAAFQLLNVTSASSSSSGGAGWDDGQLDATFITRAAIQNLDVALLYKDGTVSPAALSSRTSPFNPLGLSRERNYESIKPITPGAAVSGVGSYTWAVGETVATLSNGNFVVLNPTANAVRPTATIYDPSGELITLIELDSAQLNTISGLVQGTPMFVVALAGGGFAVSWTPYGNNQAVSLMCARYAVYSNTGAVVHAAADVGTVGSTFGVTSTAWGHRISRMVALTGGGFGILYTYGHEGKASSARTLLATTFNAVGVQQGATLTLITYPNTISGPTFAPDGDGTNGFFLDQYTNAIPLPNGSWALVSATVTSSVTTFHHAIITSAGALTGTLNIFNNALITNKTVRWFCMAADQSDGSYYIAFATDDNNQGIVIAKIDSGNVYASKLDIPAGPRNTSHTAFDIITRTGGGFTLLFRRGQTVFTGQFGTVSTGLQRFSYDSAFVLQSGSGVIPDTTVTLSYGSYGQYSHMRAKVMPDGSIWATTWQTQSVLYGCSVVLDSNLDALHVLPFNQSALGYDPVFYTPTAIGATYAHPDDPTVKVTPVYFTDSFSSNPLKSNVQLIANKIEARAIIGVAQQGVGSGAGVKVLTRGNTDTRLDWGAGLTFNHRLSSPELIGNAGYLLANKASIGGPVRAGEQIRNSINIYLNSSLSYIVPQGCRLEGYTQAQPNNATLYVNGNLSVFPITNAGNLEVHVTANGGDILSVYGALNINGWLISGN